MKPKKPRKPEPLTPTEEREWREQMQRAADGSCWPWQEGNVEWMLRLFATLDAARERIAVVERERDEALERWREHKTTCCCCQMIADRDALLAEVEAWRRFDDDGCTGSFGVTARRLQAINEGGA
jgi:hypothetical protein